MSNPATWRRSGGALLTLSTNRHTAQHRIGVSGQFEVLGAGLVLAVSIREERTMANTNADTFPSGTADLGDRIADQAERIRDRAADAGQQAMKAVDVGRQKAASGLETAADKLHSGADRLGGERVTRAAHKTADALGATGRYMRENSFGDMLSDAGEVVKAHPTQALLAALAVGFLVGRSMRRS
jgi:ElaB/YqjD/DUF883 family membrane-anchored ribosome-binding protein